MEPYGCALGRVFRETSVSGIRSRKSQDESGTLCFVKAIRYMSAALQKFDGS